MQQDSPQSATTQRLISAHKRTKKIVIACMMLLIIIAASAIWWYVLRGNDNQSSSNNAQSVAVNSFDECAAAGYPILETFPEQCKTPDGKTFTKEIANEEVADKDKSCLENETYFSNKDFGAAFCYPSEWGSANVMDAKMDSGDTGYREAVRFMANTKFIVGGVSEDWTTTMGRDGTCYDPSNRLVELSEYDTDWHDIQGEGMAVEYAIRSLETSTGGYDMSEEVTNLLGNGVCASGHKLINGSRYRVVSAAYYQEFSEASGVISPKAHMDNPNILFSAIQRQQFDRLLATLTAF